MKIKVNGKEQELDDRMTILAFLQSKGIHPAAVIVEHNFEIPDRYTWDTVLLNEGDTLEVVKFMGGG